MGRGGAFFAQQVDERPSEIFRRPEIILFGGQGVWAKIPVYLGVAAVCGAGLLYIAGLLLPETRSLSKTIVFDAPIDIVYRTVTDNRHWHYRTSLDD